MPHVFAVSLLMGRYIGCTAPSTPVAADSHTAFVLLWTQLVAGNLGPSPNGGLACYVSNARGISTILSPGQYQALTGSKCAFPTDDDF